MALDPIETLPFCWTEVDKLLVAGIGLTILTTIVSIVVVTWRAAADRVRGLCVLHRLRALHPSPEEPKDLPPVTDGRYR